MSSILAVKKQNNIIRNNKIENKDICLLCGGKLDEFFVCENCGNNSYITAKKRITQISDNNTFKELKIDKIEKSVIMKKKFLNKKKSGLNEAIIIGACTIGGIKTVLGVMDSKFLMGTLSVSVGETITKSFEYATNKKLPVILFCSSGGARIQEGMFALIQMAKINVSIKK